MLEAGKKIGSYILVRKLGSGGFGEVWQAEKHSKLSISNFALKFFRPKEEDKISLEKEKREIGIWQKVSGLPNIISIIEADEFEEYIYVVSEFADGGSLEKQMLENGGKAFPVEYAVTTILEVLSGLNSLHQMSFVHRDIKPANILIRRGVHCLADFGISREMKAHSKSTQTAGTYEYMSPEAFENKPVTIHSDIWAAGAIMQQLLTGELPFPQKEIPSLIYAILHGEPQKMPDYIPAGLKEIVKKSLEKTPTNRFNSAAEMISALKYQHMLLTKPEWGQASQETLVWEDNSKTQKFTGQAVSAPELRARITGEPQKAQNTVAVQHTEQQTQHSQNFDLMTPDEGQRKKSKRPLIFAIAGGGAFLLLLMVVAAAAFVFKNSNLFSNNAVTTNNAVSNVNSNPKTDNTAADKNTNQNIQTTTENLPPQKDEGSSAPGSSSDAEPSVTSTPVSKPSPNVVKQKENVPPVTKPTPVIKQNNTPKKPTKKDNPDCIFNGDC